MTKSEGSGARASLDEMGNGIVALLLIIEVISVALLWSLDSLTTSGQNAFAIYLAVDMVAFAMMSYVYRTLKEEERLSKIFLMAGSIFIVVLFFVSFMV